MVGAGAPGRDTSSEWPGNTSLSRHITLSWKDRSILPLSSLPKVAHHSEKGDIYRRSHIRTHLSFLNSKRNCMKSKSMVAAYVTFCHNPGWPPGLHKGSSDATPLWREKPWRTFTQAPPRARITGSLEPQRKFHRNFLSSPCHI